MLFLLWPQHCCRFFVLWTAKLLVRLHELSWNPGDRNSELQGVVGHVRNIAGRAETFYFTRDARAAELSRDGATFERTCFLPPLFTSNALGARVLRSFAIAMQGKGIYSHLGPAS